MSQGKYSRAPQPSRFSENRYTPETHGRFYVIISCIAAAVAILTLCTCLLLNKTASQVPADASSQTEVSPDSSSFSSADLASSGGDTVSSENSSSDDVSSAVTGSADAGAFDDNPIDAALEQAVGAAGNTAQLLNAYETGLNAWKTEIAKEVTRLKRVMQNSSSFSAEQAAWEQQVEADYAGSEAEGEGTNAPLNRVHAAYDAYRARAKELYERLITYDPAYTIN